MLGVLSLYHHHSSLDHRVVCDVVYSKDPDLCRGAVRRRLLTHRRSHLLHRLADHHLIEAEDLVDVADDLESLVDHDPQADYKLPTSMFQFAAIGSRR